MALKARQLQLIEALMANPMISDVKIAKELGINNKTVGVWRKMPEFQEELKARLKDKWQDAERQAQETMINLVQEGDFKAAKYVLDSCGYAPAHNIKLDADVKDEITITIGD